MKIDLPDVNDDIEMEEQIHDYDKMVAMSVIEAEMNLMKEFMTKFTGNEKDFFSDKYNNLEF